MTKGYEFLNRTEVTYSEAMPKEQRISGNFEVVYSEMAVTNLKKALWYLPHKSWICRTIEETNRFVNKIQSQGFSVWFVRIA